MKIVCEREQLLTAFHTAALVVPARTTKAVLKCVKLEASETGSVLTATDLEVGIRMDVSGVEVESAGVLLAPVAQMGSILRESNDEKLRIETGPQGMTVFGEHSIFHIPLQDPEEFPQLVNFGEDAYFEVSARLFRELIRRTLFATNPESTRYALGGVLLQTEEGRLVAVAADGRRLAKMEGPLQTVGQPSSGGSMTIVPSRAMQLMERAITETEAEVRISIRDNDVLVRSPQTTVYSRLVEGRFPNWRDVFPVRDKSVKLDMAVGPLYSTLRQAAVVASEESRGIDFEFADGTLVLTAATAEVGNSRVEIPISYTGATIQIRLDHRYVADFLRVLEPERTVTLDFVDAKSAVLFTTDDGYAYLVMPMSREKKA